MISLFLLLRSDFWDRLFGSMRIIGLKISRLFRSFGIDEASVFLLQENIANDLGASECVVGNDGRVHLASSGRGRLTSRWISTDHVISFKACSAGIDVITLGTMFDTARKALLVLSQEESVVTILANIIIADFAIRGFALETLVVHGVVSINAFKAFIFGIAIGALFRARNASFIFLRIERFIAVNATFLVAIDAISGALVARAVRPDSKVVVTMSA